MTMEKHLTQFQAQIEAVRKSVESAIFEIVDTGNFQKDGFDELIERAKIDLASSLPVPLKEFAETDGKARTRHSGHAETELEAVLQAALNQAGRDLSVSVAGLTLRVISY